MHIDLARQPNTHHRLFHSTFNRKNFIISCETKTFKDSPYYFHQTHSQMTSGNGYGLIVTQNSYNYGLGFLVGTNIQHLDQNSVCTQILQTTSIAHSLLIIIFLQFLDIHRNFQTQLHTNPDSVRIWAQFPEPLSLVFNVKTLSSCPFWKGQSILYNSSIWCLPLIFLESDCFPQLPYVVTGCPHLAAIGNSVIIHSILSIFLIQKPDYSAHSNLITIKISLFLGYCTVMDRIFKNSYIQTQIKGVLSTLSLFKRLLLFHFFYHNGSPIYLHPY